MEYSCGLFLAAGYEFQYWRYLACTGRVGKAAQRFSEIKECMDHVEQYLPKPPGRVIWKGLEEHIRYPNLPAAICLCNRASVLLKLAGPRPTSTADDVGLKFAERALRDAKDAVELFCPEYEKGHHRLLECYKRLGMTSEAKQQAEDIHSFQELQALMPCVSFGLLQLGWITHPEFTFIYDNIRKQEILKRIIAATEVPSWYVQISMVPFAGGQAILFNMNSAPFFGDFIDYRAVTFCICDCENDDDLELPPHGKISQVALKNAINLIRVFMRMLRRNRIQVATVILGQGLVEQVELTRKAIARTHPDLTIIPAQQTHASTLHLGPDHIADHFMDAMQVHQNNL